MLSTLSKILHSRAKGWIILVLLGLFATYIAITLPLLVSAPGGDIESLDAQFFYTPDQAFSTIELYGDAGSFWIWMYLTWDVATPILYSLLFGLTISWLFLRGFSPGSKIQILKREITHPD